MTETTILDESAVSKIELWRGRAQSLIDWQNGVPMSVATEGEFYISSLLQNIPPAFIVTVCNRAKDANHLDVQLKAVTQERDDLQSQLEQLRAERDDLVVHVEERDSLLSAQGDFRASAAPVVDARTEIVKRIALARTEKANAEKSGYDRDALRLDGAVGVLENLLEDIDIAAATAAPVEQSSETKETQDRTNVQVGK